MCLKLGEQTKEARKLSEVLRKPLYQPSEVNEVWNMEFMSDVYEMAEHFKALNVIDIRNREFLLLIGTSLQTNNRRFQISKMEKTKEILTLSSIRGSDLTPKDRVKKGKKQSVWL